MGSMETRIIAMEYCSVGVELAVPAAELTCTVRLMMTLRRISASGYSSAESTYIMPEK